MVIKRSENSYINNDILPFLHTNYNYPIHDSESVRINDVPLFSASGSRTGSTIDIVYYHNGIPLLLVEAKTKHKTHGQALKQALIYLKNFPYDKVEYSANGKKPKYIATTVGNEINFYKWAIDYEKADFIAEPTDIKYFNNILAEYGLSKGYKAVKIKPENFRTDFFDELIDVFINKDRKITPSVIIKSSEQILAYLWNKDKYYGQKPYIDLSLQKQKAVRDLFNKFNFYNSIGEEIAIEYRKIVLRAFQGGGFNQYLTEQCIIDFMVELIGKINKNSKVLDFECGSGGFLSVILKKDKLSLKNIKGIDIAELPYIVSKTYLALYFKLKGKNILENIPIVKSNGLFNYGNNWDVVIGNPAGNKNYRHGNLKRILNEGLIRINSSKGNCSEYELSIQQAIRSVKIGGKICLILTESFFSNSSDEQLRRYVANKMKVKAIISLPRGVFKEGISVGKKSQGAHKTTMKMSILFAVKTDKLNYKIKEKVDLKKLSYPVFLASIKEQNASNIEKKGQICDWLERELNVVMNEWKKWAK